MTLPGGAAKCDNCDELYPEVNGWPSEDGKHHFCSSECCSEFEQEAEENKEQHRFEVACYESERGA